MAVTSTYIPTNAVQGFPEGTMLSEMRHKKTNTTWFHLHMESKKQNKETNKQKMKQNKTYKPKTQKQNHKYEEQTGDCHTGEWAKYME